MARAIMLQGTGSDVGKTVLVAGLCRLARMRGMNVRPFKPQNMSNNAAVAERPLPDGTFGEIGRAQQLQALACGVPSSVDMNPVLLKPQSEVGSQVVVQGRVVGNAKGRDYQKLKPQLMGAVMDSFERLSAECDLVIVEGAGSPAEVNLRAGDIANMGFATRANVPVVLVGDIDRGGVIASIVGTHTILPPEDRAMIRGTLINKFRGDVSLFDEGLTIMERFTGWPGFGVVPYLPEAARLPAEDSVALERALAPSAGAFTVVVPVLSRIANYDDLDPLIAEPGMNVRFVRANEAFPDSADLVLLPGSKSTIADLTELHERGWAAAIVSLAKRDVPVLGICGGYQMLGHSVRDPDGIEGPATEARGLGLLDVRTDLVPRKVVRNVSAADPTSGEPMSGYEIHMGRTHGPDTDRPWLTLDGRPHGATSLNGLVRGCYLHGLFAADGWRRHFLRSLGVAAAADGSYAVAVDDALDAIAGRLGDLVDPAIFELR